MDSYIFFKKLFIKEEFIDRKEKFNEDPVDVIIPMVSSNILFEKNLYSFYREIPINRLLIGDNGIEDDTKDILKNFPRVKIIDQKKYISLGYCIAELISMVETEWFIYLHSDVLLPENWYDIMEKYQGKYDWFECDRRYITMTEHYIPHMKNKERAYSGSQMGLKKAFEKIIPKIQDDYLYRNEDIIYQELILKDGFKYGKVFDTFHYHEATNKKGEREPSFKDVIVEYYPNRDYDIKTYNMQSRGIIKYLSPKPYLIEEVNEPLKILQAHGALNIREFRKWVILNNSQWLDYLFFEKKESFMLKVLKKFRTLLIPIIDKIFNTKTQTSIIKKKVQSTKDDKKKMPQTQSNEIQKKILDVGCGTDKEPGAIGIDIANLPGVDIVQDLNVFPWGELEDESFDEIYMKDTIEHLDDPVGVMRECYRLLKDGGKLYVRVTYWNHKYSFSDPTHKHAFSEISFKFFVGEWRAYYMDFQFKNLNIDYIFDPNAIKKFGKNPKKLIEKAYFYCNIIQGMNITLTK